MALTKVTMGLLGGLVAKVQEIMQNHSNIFLGEAKAATGTFMDFDIPAGVKRISLIFSGLSTTGTSIIQIQLGTNAGFEISGYLGGVNGASTAVVPTVFSTGLAVDRQGMSAASEVRHGRAVFTYMWDNLWEGDQRNAHSSDGSVSLSACTKQMPSDVTRIRITTVNGTDQFDAGTINISWEF